MGVRHLLLTLSWRVVFSRFSNKGYERSESSVDVRSSGTKKPLPMAGILLDVRAVGDRGVNSSQGSLRLGWRMDDAPSINYSRPLIADQEKIAV